MQGLQVSTDTVRGKASFGWLSDLFENILKYFPPLLDFFSYMFVQPLLDARWTLMDIFHQS